MKQKLVDYSLILIIALSASTMIMACHPPSTVTTTPGKVAYTADQVATRVNELENAAIAANATNGLSTPTTRTIVQFAVAADQILAKTPQGWAASLTQLWTDAKAQAGTVTNPAIVAAMAAVDVVLATTGGQ